MSRTTMSVALAAVVLTGGAVLAGCSSDADVVNQNITKDSDNFKVDRRITFYNGITDKYMFVIEGFCSISPEDKKLTVTCKVGDGYKRDYLGLSDNVTYMVEQLDSANVSADHYTVIFKPESIVPSIQQR